MATVPDSHHEASEAAESRAALRVSAYDNVASLLIALLILIGFTVLMLIIVWLTTRDWMFLNKAVSVELLQYAGRGDHAAGFERDPEEPGLEEMEELMEPQIEATLEAVTDVVSSQAAAFDAIDMAANATSKGAGGMGDSRPPGPPGEGVTDVIPPWERWEIRFSTSGINVYARQLDHFDIELGAFGGGSPKVDYAYNLAGSPPSRKQGEPDEEKRMYMSWQEGSGPMAVFDQTLVRRAGIKTDRRVIVQFYPKATEQMLQDVEFQAAAEKQGTTPQRLDPRTLQKTIFGVRSTRGGYEFYVIDQLFRPAPAS